MEQWKDIPGWKGKYQINKLGEVRSLNYKMKRYPRILKQQTWEGQTYVVFSFAGQRSKHYIKDLLNLTYNF
jgi:hypothetical protein